MSSRVPERVLTFYGPNGMQETFFTYPQIIGRDFFRKFYSNVPELNFISREQIIISYEDGKYFVEEVPNAKNGSWIITGKKVLKLEPGKKTEIPSECDINVARYFVLKLKY
ncbi:hypothetical protein [Caldiplasma sukawensis]